MRKWKPVTTSHQGEPPTKGWVSAILRAEARCGDADNHWTPLLLCISAINNLMFNGHLLLLMLYIYHPLRLWCPTLEILECGVMNCVDIWSLIYSALPDHHPLK